MEKNQDILHVQVLLSPRTIRTFKKVIREREYNNMAEFFREIIRGVVKNG